MLHEISRTYHQVRDTSLKEYFGEKERQGKLCWSVHSWSCKQQHD